jgi:hypothetical protein
MDNLNYTDSDAFDARVGLIYDPERLRAIGAPAYFDENGMFDYDKEFFEQIDAFLAANPQYHLATLTSDSDDAESEAVKRVWLKLHPECTEDDYERLSEENDDFYENFREEYPVFVTTISNSRRWVNRMGFYLCDGDPNEEISLCEVNYEFDEPAM